MRIINSEFMDDILFESLEDPYQGNNIDDIVNQLTADFKLTPSEYMQLKNRAVAIDPKFLLEMRNR